MKERKKKKGRRETIRCLEQSNWRLRRKTLYSWRRLIRNKEPYNRTPRRSLSFLFSGFQLSREEETKRRRGGREREPAVAQREIRDVELQLCSRFYSNAGIFYRNLSHPFFDLNHRGDTEETENKTHRKHHHHHPTQFPLLGDKQPNLPGRLRVACNCCVSLVGMSRFYRLTMPPNTCQARH